MANKRLARPLAFLPETPRNKFIVLASIFVLFAIFYSVFASMLQNPWKDIRVVTPNAVHRFKVEVANTEFEKLRGLMFRKILSEEKGMLFVYDKPDLQTFWMKNTLIPLDILFIGSDLKIKTISEYTPPCPRNTPCPTYGSSEPVQYVLELNGGICEKQKIEVGDKLVLTYANDDSNGGQP